MRTVIIWIRSILFSVAFFLWTVIPPILFLWVLFLGEKKVCAVIRFWQATATGLAKVLAGIDYRIVGREHVPEGACIIAAKHQSAWETCILNVLFNDPAIVLKKELTHVPIWGWYAKASGLIPIDRKAGARALSIMMRAANKAVEAGRKIVIFPQGTRVRPGVRKPYKSGVAGLYLELNVPVVPMALNSGLFWPKGSFLKRPGIVTIEFLPPIPPGLPKSVFMHTLEERLEATSDKLAARIRRV